MTTCVAVVGKSEAVMVADGLETWHSMVTSRRRRKLFRVGTKAAICTGGNSRTLNLVEDLAESKEGAGDLLSTPGDFFPALRDRMKEDGFVVGDKDTGGGTASSGQMFLFLNLEGLWSTAVDWTTFPVEDVDAFGTGADYALGAMRVPALLGHQIDPEILARIGLTMGARYCCFTGGDLFSFVRRREGKLEFWDESELLLKSPGSQTETR